MAYQFQQPYFGWGGGLQTLQVGGAIGGWKELGRTTLGSANSDISVASLPNKRYYMVLNSMTGSSIGVDNCFRYNSDSGTNYSNRYSYDGSGDGTGINNVFGRIDVKANTQTTPFFGVSYISNYSTKEKLCQSHMVGQYNAGAGTVPQRSEVIHKWANTSNAINEIINTTAGASTFNTGSEVVVLGWDEADTDTTNFWEELASVTAGGASTNISSGTITAKKYLWIQAWVESTSAHVTNMTFNNDTTTYAYRNSDDGGADATSTSDSHIEIAQSSSTALFTNMFIINNSANEKLVIGHTINQGTAGAGTAPNRREFVGKYDNTAAQITEIDLDSSSGNWASNSIIKVWGSD